MVGHLVTEDDERTLTSDLPGHNKGTELPICERLLARGAEPMTEQLKALRIVFDGPPGPEGPRFVECETPDGRSVNAGEWRVRADGYWELRINTRPSPEADALRRAALASREERR